MTVLSVATVMVFRTIQTTASTIIAASAPNIVAEIAAPINSPNTKKNSILNITATIAKQLNFLHFLFVS